MPRNYFLLFLLAIIICCSLYKTQENFKNGNRLNPLHSLFDPIYVITLPKRSRYIKGVMNSIRLFPTYLDATDKYKLSCSQLKQQGKISSSYDCKSNLGRIACHDSHIRALTDFLNTGKKQCLILEDDVSTKKYEKDYFKNIVKEIKEFLPKDYDILYLGRCWDKKKHVTPISYNIIKTMNPLCRHAYAVTRAGAQKIIEHTKTMNNNGDHMYLKLIQSGKLNAYAITPPMFYQNRNALKSELGNVFSAREYHFM